MQTQLAVTPTWGGKMGLPDQPRQGAASAELCTSPHCYVLRTITTQPERDEQLTWICLHSAPPLNHEADSLSETSMAQTDLASSDCSGPELSSLMQRA